MDSVADHQRPIAGTYLIQHIGHLLGGKSLGAHLGDSETFGDAKGDARPITGDQELMLHQ